MYNNLRASSGNWRGLSHSYNPMDDNEAMLEVQRSLGRIESDVKTLLEGSKAQGKRLDAFGERVSTVEKWQYKVLGLSTGVSLVVGFVWRLIVS